MMATMELGIDDVDHITFECPVCFEQIDDTWRMLSCQHTFCSGCLEKIYESKQNPQCPTCREVIAVSIEVLQRPQLLFNLYEKYRVGGEKNNENEDESSPTEQSKETIYVELESVGSDDQEEDTYQSNPVTEMMTMIQSCTFQSNSNQLESRPVQSDSLGSSSHSTPIPEPMLNNNTEGVMISVMASESSCTGVLAEDPSIDPPEVSDLLISHGENNNLTSRLHVPDLSNYLRINPPKFVLNALMLETMDENKLNSLEKFKILEYLEFINDHLNALKLYRRDKIMEIKTEHNDENREIVEHILSLDNQDDNCSREAATTNSEYEDDDLRLALEMSRQTYIQTNGDVLFDIALKKSEILDPIDSLQIRFRNIREKLEFRKSVIESMGSI